MNKEDVKNWHNSNILLISNTHTQLVDFIQTVGLDQLQITTMATAESQLTKAAKSHEHFQMIFIEADEITQELTSLIQQLQLNAIYRLPIVTLFTTKQNEITEQIQSAQLNCEVLTTPQNQQQLESNIEHAYNNHLNKKQDLVERLNQFKPNILVVEDDQVNQQIFKLMLDSINCDYDLVSTGTDAIEKTTENNYDVMLLDIGLPDIDGFDVTKQIRSDEHHNKKLPVIAVTAFIPKDAIARCQEVGMNDVITKPVMLPGLQYAIACNLVDRI